MARNQRSPKSDSGVWNLDDVEEKVADSTQWGLIGPKAYKGFPRTQRSLPAGVYSITMDMNDNKTIFMRRDIKTDGLVTLEEGLTASTLREIELFWDKAELFKSRGFLHRRGYLFYGPQGTGKSSLVRQIMEDVVRKKGIVFLCDNPKFFNQGLITLRQAEPDRLLVCVYEDIDAIIARYGEDDLLAVLDGANMVDNVLNIATTNYPERLDRRIISRPRRFDRVIKVGVPGATVRRSYLAAQLPELKKGELSGLVLKTQGLSLAALSELIISVYCLGNGLDDTIAILHQLADGRPTSGEFQKGGAVGYAADFGGELSED